MRTRYALAVAVVLSPAVVYAAYPYATLYRLRAAVHHGDTATLAALVDWDQVREGITEDICDTVLDQPADAPDSVTSGAAASAAPSKVSLVPTAQAATVHQDSTQLPPFGFSFMHGITGSGVEAEVTPAALIQAGRDRRTGASVGAKPMRITWAFFDSPTAFTVDLMPRGKALPNPVELRLELRGTRWVVTRATLPTEMLRRLSG